MDDKILLNLLVENIPDLFQLKKRGNILYIYPSKNGLLIDKFKEAGFVVDCLEPDYREYHEAMFSGIYRLVVNEEIKHYDPQIEYDIMIWLGIDEISKEQLKRIEDVSEEWSKLLILCWNKDSYNKDSFILKKYYVNNKDNIMMGWRNYK